MLVFPALSEVWREAGGSEFRVILNYSEFSISVSYLTACLKEGREWESRISF